MPGCLEIVEKVSFERVIFLKKIIKLQRLVTITGGQEVLKVIFITDHAR